jgi:hypothetical protein
MMHLGQSREEKSRGSIFSGWPHAGEGRHGPFHFVAQRIFWLTERRAKLNGRSRADENETGRRG